MIVIVAAHRFPLYLITIFIFEIIWIRLCKKARRTRARFSEYLIMFEIKVSERMKDERAHSAEVLI